MINYKIIDNLLPEEDFKKLYDYIVFNIQFPLTIDSGVGYGPNNEDYNKELEMILEIGMLLIYHTLMMFLSVIVMM